MKNFLCALILIGFNTITAFAINNVTFQVNMKLQMKISNFDKSKDTIVVRGDFNGWGGNNHKMVDLDGDSIYVGTFDVGNTTLIRYKYVVISTKSKRDEWEINDDRVDTLDSFPWTLPVAWFNKDSATVNITFQVDMSVQIGLSKFNKDWDSVLVLDDYFDHYFIPYGKPPGFVLTDSNNDNIYTGAFDIIYHSNIYKYRFISFQEEELDYRIDSALGMINKIYPVVWFKNVKAAIQLTPLSDSLRYGNIYSIMWKANFVGKIKIEYSINNGLEWKLVETDIEANISNYKWLAPSVAPVSSQCKIRIIMMNDSAIVAESPLFTMYSKVVSPTININSGIYTTPQEVSISSTTDSATIYFTLDGSEPNEGTTTYTAPILIDTNKILKTKAFRKDWIASDTKTVNYTINGQVFTVNYNTPSIWFDANFDGKESKTITPITSISYGSIVGYEWKIGNNVIGTSNSANAELPTGTWYVVLSMTSDRGIVKKDSVKISVYAAEATTTGSIESAVSQLSENIYFVTSKGGSVYRFDTTGVIAWTIQTGGSIQSTTCVSSQDNIYVGSNDTRLYSFDYQGTPRWDKAMGGTIVSSPSSGFDTLIYVGISTGRLFALDEAGNIKWSVQTGGAIYSSPSIDENGVAYFGSDDNKLYAVSSNGTILWTYSAIAAIRTSPALGADSSIVFGSLDGFIYKVGKDGQVKWDVFVGGSVKSSPIIGLDGIIYIGSNDGKLYSLAKDGQELWEFNAGSPINVTPALSADGTIYFGTMNGTIFALDQNGKQKWMLQTGKPILAPMLVTNSKMLMVGDTLGKVYIMKIPSDSALVNLNTEFVASTKNISESAYEWWTFKGNNQRTGYRKSIITSVKNPFQKIPEKFALRQNYPNPFNPTTIIEYDLPKDSRVKILVFDMLGRQVRMLVDEEKSGGSYKVEFNANNLSSGVYFYHLQTNEFAQTKKLVLMR